MTKKEQKDKMSNSPLISKKTTRGVVSSIMDLKRRKTCNLIFEFFFFCRQNTSKRKRENTNKKNEKMKNTHRKTKKQEDVRSRKKHKEGVKKY